MSIRRIPWTTWLFLGAMLIFILLALYARAGEKPTLPVQTFRKAKAAARDRVYLDRRITFYCSCYFYPKGESGGVIDPSDCGFQHTAPPDPVGEWEKIRDGRIEGIQGNTNPFVKE